LSLRGSNPTQPRRDLLARPLVVVVQVDDERADRNLLLAARRAPARRVLQAIEEPIQTLRHGVVRVGRQQVDAFVRGAKRARSAVGAEVAPEGLRRAAPDARQDGFGQLDLVVSGGAHVHLARGGDSRPPACLRKPCRD